MLNIEDKILVVGLGNIGKEYEHTKHNVGFDVVDDLDYLLTNSDDNYRSAFNGQYVQAKVNNNTIYLLKPSTYMNNSGLSVRPFADYFKINFNNIIVIQDDMDLELGQIKAKYSTGDGGHRGIRSINQQLGFTSYLRIKVGIGKPKTKEEVVDFVLTTFKNEEKEIYENAIKEATKLTYLIITNGYDKGMNKYYSLTNKNNHTNN